MKRSLMVLLVACALTGCDRSSPVKLGRVPRQTANPWIPAHPMRSRLIGEWQADGESVLVVETNTSGEVAIRSLQDMPWDSVINNVRWDGDTLLYDEYLYYSGSEDFKTISNPVGDHPYSGVRNEVTIRFTDDPNRLKQTCSTVHTPQPIEGELTRSLGSR